jgi:hypothetical protein
MSFKKVNYLFNTLIRSSKTPKLFALTSFFGLLRYKYSIHAYDQYDVSWFKFKTSGQNIFFSIMDYMRPFHVWNWKHLMTTKFKSMYFLAARYIRPFDANNVRRKIRRLSCVPKASTQYFLQLYIPRTELVLRGRSFCRLHSWGWWWTQHRETKSSFRAVRSSRHPTKWKEFVSAPDNTDVFVSWHHVRSAWGKNCRPAELNL